MSTYFDPGNGKHVIVDGNIVEKDALRIAEKIQEYDPDLMLICVDPEDPRLNISTCPFLVIRRKPDGTFERVLEAWTLDDKLLERIHFADGTKFNALDRLVSLENQKKKEREDAAKEKMGGNHELFAAAMHNPKSNYTFHNDKGELVRINDNDGVIKDNRKKSFS